LTEPHAWWEHVFLRGRLYAGPRFPFREVLAYAVGVTRMFHALTLLTVLAGCGTEWSVGTARRAIELTAEAVQSTDTVGGEAYRRVLDQAEAEELTVAEFDARTAKFESLTAAVTVSRETLAVAEAAVDTWAATGDDTHWLAVAPCVFVVLQRILSVLDELGIELPGVLGRAVAYITDRDLGTCAEAS
jgi:hypothetical protein